MKVALVTFNASSNGISLHVVPETDQEEELLRGLWRHGVLERCNGIGNRGAGFAISWSLRKESQEADT